MDKIGSFLATRVLEEHSLKSCGLPPKNDVAVICEVEAFSLYERGLSKELT